MQFNRESNQFSGQEGSLRSLPLLTLHLTERCNSRCVSCDYWRHGRNDTTAESVAALLPSLRQLNTRTVLISGGEPLIHPQWSAIAALLADNDLDLWLHTSGLSLAKHAVRVSELFSSVTVSLDGANADTYRAIRGVDAFDKVCEGVRSLAALGTPVAIRMTVQRLNYLELPDSVALARRLNAAQISFLAADITTSEAFGRRPEFTADIALQPADLPRFNEVLAQLERDHEGDFASGFIAEHPRKLRRILAYYMAHCGLGEFPSVRCNAPEFSAVLEATGRVRPCFFIAGPGGTRVGTDMAISLNEPSMQSLREDIRAGHRPECRTCVCSLWLEENERETLSIRALQRMRAMQRGQLTGAR